MSDRYINSFHNPMNPDNGPSHFEADSKPVEHNGFLIYKRMERCFDIVDPRGETPVCVGMYAGLESAKRSIGFRFAKPNPTESQQP